MRSLSSSYAVNPLDPGGCRIAVRPDAPGNPTNLTVDDTYSGVLNITFPFPFFGSTYTQLVASTNGYLSFDISRANLPSHWGILSTGTALSANAGTPYNLPGTLYDKALIMAPYHDLNPFYATSTTKQIKYDVIGTAPYRKWVLSFNKVPLYSVPCQFLIDNTQQIILYESLGIVEVVVIDKEICNTWNQGRAMIGLQDFTKTQAIMAPGRQASDPPWGFPGMNESWRFVPKDGPTLYRKVELLTLGGALVATGDTVGIGNNTFEVTFPNVCSANSGTTSFVIKSTYKKWDDPGQDIFAYDTINVIRNAAGISTNSGGANCITGLGTIVVVDPTGPSYEYSIDGTSWQTSNIFNVPPGTYTVQARVIGTNCVSFTTVTISNSSTLDATATSTNTTCSGSVTGSITINATGGVTPYTFSLNNGTPQTSNIFTGLAAGSYNAKIIDAGGCQKIITVTVGNGSGITASATTGNTACSSALTGTATVSASSGTTPYTYSIDGGTFQNSNQFTGLSAGTHSIIVQDAAGCQFTVSITISSDPGVTAVTGSSNAGCPGSASGSITVSANAGITPYTYSINGGPFQSSNQFNNLVAGNYTITVKDAAGCTVIVTQTVGNNPLVTATLGIVPPACNGAANGSITVNASLGAPPYTYSLNALPFQSSNVFNALVSGSYIVHVKDALGCTVDININLTQPGGLSAVADTLGATCSGNTDGRITINATGGSPPYQYSKDNGTNYQGANIFNVTAGIYNVVVKDANGCSIPLTVTVNLNDNMFLSLGVDTLESCSGSTFTLNPSASVGTGIFNWTPAGGSLNASTGAYTVSPTDTTMYRLTATWGACQRKDSVLVFILRKPVANAGADTIICDKTFAILRGKAANTSGAVNYLWSPATDILNPSSANTVATPTTAGDHTYTLEVSDNYGCGFKVTDDIKVTMNPSVPAFAGNDTIAAMNIPHQLYGSGGLTYLWSPPNVLDNPLSPTPIATLKSDTRFVLIVVDNGGCVGTSSVLVKVYKGPTFYVPNAFTPNGDGLNDVFQATPPGIKSTDFFRIYNRFGQLIFEAKANNAGWDGTYMGKPQPIGIYVWMIRGIDKFDAVVEMKGTVMLVK